MKLRLVTLLSMAVAGWSLAGAAFGQLLAGEKEVKVTAIPGVIAADAKWENFWADFVTADGIVGTADGGVLFAQEQTDKLIKLDAEGKQYTFLENTNGAGAVSIDTQGRVYMVQRACTEPQNPELAGCNELTTVAQAYPEYKVLANSFADGKPLGRLNDLIADGKGGAYFTVSGVFYVNAAGVVSAVADQDIRPNGLTLSPNGRVLYATNNTDILAFDIKDDGTTQNRRVFGTLNGDSGGDGMAVDTEGRVYVTGALGVHILSPQGQYLGLIPTPRRPITLAFSGPGKRMLYVPQMGAVGPNGKTWETPQGIRNTAMTIYRIPMLAQGIMTRPK